MSVSDLIKQLDVFTDELMLAIGMHNYDLCNELESKREILINGLLEKKVEITDSQKEALKIIINKQSIATVKVDCIKKETEKKFKNLVVNGKMISIYKQWDKK